MSINFDFIETWRLLLDSVRYDVLLSIVLGSILLCFICIINNKFGRCLVIIVNVILLFLIGKYYIKEIIEFNFSDPINNMYFYFFNSIIFIIVFTLEAIFDYLLKYDYIFYSLFLMGISFSLFMTNYLYNAHDIVILNIYPMIKFGNILMLIYYVVVLTKLGYHVIIKKTSKRSGRL